MSKSQDVHHRSTHHDSNYPQAEMIQNCLVVWNMFRFSHHIGNFIIPTDELIFHIFQRGWYTTKQKNTYAQRLVSLQSKSFDVIFSIPPSMLLKSHHCRDGFMNIYWHCITFYQPYFQALWQSPTIQESFQ